MVVSFNFWGAEIQIVIWIVFLAQVFLPVWDTLCTFKLGYVVSALENSSLRPIKMLLLDVVQKFNLHCILHGSNYHFPTN